MISASDPARAEEQAPNLVPPAGNPRFPLFDALRAIAALSVFAGHTVTEVLSLNAHRVLFIWALTLADQGVAIFFLISGFLLYRPFLVARRGGPPLRLRSYARRRVLRIVPAYWVALSIFLAAGFVNGITGGNWWIFYAFGQIYSPNTIGHGLGVAWTLCVEVTFYAALPLFVVVAGRLGRRRSMRGDVVLLVVLAAASLAWRAHYSAFDQAEKVSTLAGTFFWFALGMALAIASVLAAEGLRGVRLPRWWPLLSWAGAVVPFVAARELEVHTAGFSLPLRYIITHVLLGLTALLILLPAVFGQGGIVRRLLAARTLAWLGLVSYAIYLYHSIALDQLDRVLPSGGGAGHYLAVAVCSLAVTLLCAAVSYYILERPIMRLGRSRRPALPGATSRVRT